MTEGQKPLTIALGGALMNYDALNQILDDEVVFYTDALNTDEVYVEFTLANGAVCFEPIKSRRFAAFLSFRYRELAEESERPDYKAALAVEEDDAIFLQTNQVAIHRRVAGSLQDGITYFLADEKWRYVVVSAEGCTICKRSALKFLKGSMDEEQVRPRKGGDYLKLMLPKLNMAHDDAILYAVFLIQAFSRNSSHFAAVISSSRGTGKSTLTKMTTELVAPTKTGAAIQPASEDDLKTMLANTYVAAFDNTATLSTAFSNILCAAITGSKAAKRKLYTNSDQVVLNLHNLVLLNGVDIVPFKSDLAERALYFELLQIKDSERRTDAEIWEEFNRDKPLILGAIFKTLSKAMAILPTVEIKKLHRMADAHKEMMAIALALGIEQAEFQRILDANQKKLQDAYAASNPFVDFVLTYLQLHSNVDAPAAKLYQSMVDSIVGDRGFFPKTPSMLSRRLNEEKDALLLAGYQFEKAKMKDSNYIKISRVPQNQLTKAQKDAAARRAALLQDASTDD